MLCVLMASLMVVVAVVVSRGSGGGGCGVSHCGEMFVLFHGGSGGGEGSDVCRCGDVEGVVTIRCSGDVG